jgi:hypothetical protein
MVIVLIINSLKFEVDYFNIGLIKVYLGVLGNF